MILERRCTPTSSPARTVSVPQPCADRFPLSSVDHFSNVLAQRRLIWTEPSTPTLLVRRDTAFNLFRCYLAEMLGIRQ